MSSTNVEAARAKLMEEMKVDILTELQEADNEKARREVSRSFICTLLHCISYIRVIYPFHSGHYNRSMTTKSLTAYA